MANRKSLVWILTALLVSACGHPRPPKPPPPPPPVEHTAHIFISVHEGDPAKRDEAIQQDHKVPGALVTLIDAETDTAVAAGHADAAGNISITVTSTAESKAIRVTAAMDGYEPDAVRAQITTVRENLPIYLVLKPIVIRGPPLSRVHVDGPIFRDEAGRPWRYKAVTAFRAPQRWESKDPTLDRFMDWAKDVGANTIRVFLQHRFLDCDANCGGAPAYPLIHPYILPIEKVRPFVDWAASKGFYVELTVLCDTEERDSEGTPGFNQSLSWQVDRVRAVLEAVKDAPNVFVEIKNEPPVNGRLVHEIVDALQLRDPRNRPVPMASGEFPETGSEAINSGPGSIYVLDYIGDHPPRKPEWPSEAPKIGFYVFKQTKAVHVEDEPIRFGESGRDGQETSPANAEDGGAGCALSSGGCTFHSWAGIHTIVPSPLEDACARAWFTAIDRIPADAPTFTYFHDGLAGHPLAETREAGEVVSRVDGSRAYIVAAQPTPRWFAAPRNDWACAPLNLPRGNILRCER